MPVPVMMGPMGPMMAAPMPAGMMPGAMAAPQLTQMLVEAARGGRSSNVFFKTRICNKWAWAGVLGAQAWPAEASLQCLWGPQRAGNTGVRLLGGAPRNWHAVTCALGHCACRRWRAGACPYGDKCT